MNVLLLIYKGEADNLTMLRERINRIGSLLYVYNNLFFVLTENNTREAYEKIATDVLESDTMLIVNFSNSYLGFWGRMPSDLWTNLADKENVTEDSLTETYNKEIERLIYENNQLTAEIKDLGEKLQDSTSANENLQQQIGALKKQLDLVTRMHMPKKSEDMSGTGD